MIPQRCYTDLYKLREKMDHRRKAFSHRQTVVDECACFIFALDGILARWERSDDKELEAMAEEYEKSEKDCMWERE